jgi:hypothetical protein
MPSTSSVPQVIDHHTVENGSPHVAAHFVHRSRQQAGRAAPVFAWEQAYELSPGGWCLEQQIQREEHDDEHVEPGRGDARRRREQARHRVLNDAIDRVSSDGKKLLRASICCARLGSCSLNRERCAVSAGARNSRIVVSAPNSTR